MKKIKTILMAGGKGTRISETFPDIPKPLIPIDNVPVLERQILSLISQGFTDITITVSHMADKIMNYIGDGNKWGASIDYFVEDIPLGNAGALFKMNLTDDFLLLNADSVFDIDFNRMLEYHRKHGGLVTLFTHPNSHPYDSGLIIANQEGQVQQWLTKEERRPNWYKNRVNAGAHIISPKVIELSGIHADDVGKIKVDLDRQLLKPLCNMGQVYCYDSPEYIKDMGTPERFHQVENDYRNGIVNAKNLKNAQKAIFLDRDGTINKYIGFLRKEEDMELLPGVGEAIKMINMSGYLAIVVTNQPVVARGEVTTKELEHIHNKMETLLGMEGAYIDAIYYCPHHPHRGYEGEVLELKIDCSCRKPKPGMIYTAAHEYNINLFDSWMVGDSESDIFAGKNAGCKTALIGTGDYGQNINGNSLLDVVTSILKVER